LNLRRELRLYKRELDALPYLVVGNKMDQPEAQEYLPIFKERTGEEPICISAMEKAGLDTIIHHLSQLNR
jgi:GTP-binding protein